MEGVWLEVKGVCVVDIMALSADEKENVGVWKRAAGDGEKVSEKRYGGERRKTR